MSGFFDKGKNNIIKWFRRNDKFYKTVPSLVRIQRKNIAQITFNVSVSLCVLLFRGRFYIIRDSNVAQYHFVAVLPARVSNILAMTYATMGEHVLIQKVWYFHFGRRISNSRLRLIISQFITYPFRVIISGLNYPFLFLQMIVTNIFLQWKKLNAITVRQRISSLVKNLGTIKDTNIIINTGMVH